MSRKKILIPMSLGLKGEFRALVHKGDGVPIIETPYGGNIITAGGIDGAFVNLVSGYCVAGDGNATPSLSDVTLDSYKGKMTTHLGVTGTVNNNPGLGDLWISSEARVQFVPGAFGISAVNIAEAGFTTGPGALSVVDSSTPLFNRGLLVDALGNPTTVAVQPDEYLDLFWRLTVNLPFEAAGTVSIDVDGVPTNFDYLVSPGNLIPSASASVSPWAYMIVESGSTNQKNTFFNNGLMNFVSATSRSGVSAAAAVAPSTAIPSVTSTMQPTSMTAQTYTNGNFYRDIDVVWTLAKGNAVGGIKTIIIYTGWTCWQVEFDPVIPKTDLKQLDMTFRLSVANTP